LDHHPPNVIMFELQPQLLPGLVSYSSRFFPLTD
jgi:hypothetical protein